MRTGLMAFRSTSINDLPILGTERTYHWPLGHCPDTAADTSNTIQDVNALSRDAAEDATSDAGPYLHQA